MFFVSATEKSDVEFAIGCTGPHSYANSYFWFDLYHLKKSITLHSQGCKYAPYFTMHMG